MTVAEAINPWAWAERFGYSQAYRVENPRALVVMSGQAPLSETGALVGDGDFAAQARQVFANLTTVLAEAGAGVGNVVKLTAFVTDMSNLQVLGEVRAEFLGGRRPAVTTLGVKELAFPGMLLEVEAVAVV